MFKITDKKIPGEVLKEEIKKANISQRELAYRTGYSEKHISTILSGEKSISPDFAKRLEYVFGYGASIWLDLQQNYDLSLVNEKEISSISVKEKEIYREVKDIVTELENNKAIVKGKTIEDKILNIRKLLHVSSLNDLDNLKNLLGIPLLRKNKDISPTYLFLMCEYVKQIDKNNLKNKLNKSKIRDNLFRFKSLMFLDYEILIDELNKILNEAGVYINVIENFPIYKPCGLIKKAKYGSYSIFINSKDVLASVFWFNFYHLIDILLTQDIDSYYFDLVKDKKEVTKGSNFIKDILINREAYKKFIQKNDFSLKTIYEFAEYNDVKPFIVIARLVEDGFLDSNSYSKERVKYHFGD